MPTKDTKKIDEEVKKTSKVEKKVTVKETNEKKASAKKAKKTTDKKDTKTKKVSAKKAVKTEKGSDIAKAVVQEKPKKRGRPKKTTIPDELNLDKKTSNKSKATKKIAPKKEPKKVTKESATSKTTTKSHAKSASSNGKKTTISKSKPIVKKFIKSYKTITPQSQFLKNNINILEYFDLPYRYNETTVKVLAQTPKVLFVYWDISDYDKEQYKLNYGENFFDETYPVLLIKNETHGYTTEVPVNDFANSWYLNVPDASSKYSVELGRKYKNKKQEESPYIFVKNSNEIISPNDHILFENLKPIIKYKNAKTNEITFKNITNVIKDGKILDFYSLYQVIYNVEDLNSFFLLNNPSSGNPTSTFK